MATRRTLVERMITYRKRIRQLDQLATPAPWASEGELYGVRANDSFKPLGFAPHRPLDSRLIAVYRSALMNLLDAVDAVERLAVRAVTNSSVPAAIGIRQILTILDILDASDGETEPFRETLAELDRRTTPPPWDPGHLTLGMELDAGLQSSLGIATPRAGDRELIAVARVAVPRALELLAFAASTVMESGRSEGSLSRDGAAAIVAEVAEFDGHRSSEGSGTGTV